ncbi:MAG TPA: LptF/LptG family permease, partial [Gemmatimonadaceae bacterium]
MARPTTDPGARPRRRRLLRPLDRYVFGEFFRIFIVTALGFPVLLVLIDLTDHLDEYLARKLPVDQVALSYVYWLPETMFLVLPAAVLFATVFAIGGFTRHSEITAAKASGISFYRLTMPIFLGAALAAGLGLVLGELSPITSTRRG